MSADKRCVIHGSPAEPMAIGRCVAWINDVDIPEADVCEFERPHTASQIRATALLAAASWLPVSDGEPELLALAERFARWIEGGEQSA